MKLNNFSVVIFGVMLSACAANSGIVPMGNDAFMVSRQAATGFSGSGNLKAEAMTEAFAYCSKLGKTVEVIQVTEAQPPFVLGNFPKAEVQFRCIDKKGA